MKRISRLRVKIVLSIVSVLAVILAIILVLLNVVLIEREIDETMEFLQGMANNGGAPQHSAPSRMMRLFRTMPAPVSDMPSADDDDDDNDFPVRLGIIGLRNSFAVRLDETNQIAAVIHRHPIPYTTREINGIIDKILLEHDEQGLMQGLLYYIKRLPHGERLICIASMQSDMQVSRVLIAYSVVVFVFALIIAFGFSWVLSGFIVRPVKEAFLKQKTFISNAGHELKTPIAVIGANLDVLLSDHADNKWLQYIKTENERMGQLVKGLLFLARTDADRLPMALCPFDFSLAVENSVLPFESIAFEQGKTLDIAVPPGFTCVGDEHQIKQVIMILVDNAIKNSVRGGVIRVSASADGKKLVVKVYNDGRGIPKEDFERIFERFYRGDESRARDTGGYGLGLPIARTIVQAHGGTISVASAYGSWAEFTVTLPRR